MTGEWTAKSTSNATCTAFRVDCCCECPHWSPNHFVERPNHPMVFGVPCCSCTVGNWMEIDKIIGWHALWFKLLKYATIKLIPKMLEKLLEPRAPRKYPLQFRPSLWTQSVLILGLFPSDGTTEMRFGWFHLVEHVIPGNPLPIFVWKVKSWVKTQKSGLH